MSDVLRVLHVVPALNAAGIESFIMNVYSQIDVNHIQFDFYVTRNREEYFEYEIKQKGGKIFKRNKTIFSFIFFLFTHKYNIIHVHATTPLQCKYVFIAALFGIKVRVLHSHSAFVSGKKKYKYIIYCLYKKLSYFATNLLACSTEAAEWLYPAKLIPQVQQIHNGIDVNKFTFNFEDRTKIRHELGLNNEITLISVGRLSSQKNQSFLINLMHKLDLSKYKMYIIGDGPDKKDLENKISNLKLDKNVYLLGLKKDVNRYLCAADIFLMPSLYEGLPVAAVEAQCSGLYCILSNNISKDAILTDNVRVQSLDIDKWYQEILYISNIIDNNNSISFRKDKSACINLAGYDNKTVKQILEYIYDGKG